MAHPEFDRNRLLVKNLSERINQISIEKNQVPLTYQSDNLSENDKKLIRKTAGKIVKARKEKQISNTCIWCPYY